MTCPSKTPAPVRQQVPPARLQRQTLTVTPQPRGTLLLTTGTACIVLDRRREY